ncbi:glycoside hydrolase family 30 protein [Tilletiaria anomala UBC 951]|uniref:Glycoside hydrolase family 30 protein n=1 Tax=Tilletiaria anomala (strain ATCC 24038 / CBS 436.72 / UBC 951) TaxID=1037660 RepID=A0A066VRX8_TILAU|nr:glycoside hydrolase family 30 protein [Tilletiaria anomala UBC 951]KDN44236.1 glycoside hydrolase family 30 protein [Tilletiaria anomala UBC 951]
MRRALTFLYLGASNQCWQKIEGWGMANADPTSIVLQEPRSKNASTYFEVLVMLFDPSKDPTSLHGGMVKPVYYAVYAKYLAKTLIALCKVGIRAYQLSTQEEPNYGPAKCAGTMINAEVEADIGDLVRPQFDQNDLHDTGLLVLVHKWGSKIYAIDFLNHSQSFAIVIRFTECTRFMQYFHEPWPKTRGQVLITSTINYRMQNVILERDAACGREPVHGPDAAQRLHNCLASVLVHADGSYMLTSTFATIAHGSLATGLRDMEM